ncbi:hypothetical protein A3B46_03015 [Candidatus Roizmanbacteria bacterium RIFCSPLOWO2_01_FULL_39_19]|nr:MAG: hypothetical protein A3B46_03015 [Candidatus Roizmanbacteria bacterium RIFCSPLOWO2_01_FULL_39_19]
MIIQDKVAIVTGATSGIGLETARLLHAQGAHLALVARSRDKLEELVKKLPESFIVVADLSKEGEARDIVKQACNHFGRVEIVVNNAGCGYDGLVENLNTDKVRQIFELNFIAPLAIMQETIPLMRKQGEGSIVNISSGTSLLNIPNISAYSSIKSALTRLSLTAREELESSNIVVSVVYPYVTDTNFGNNVLSGPRQKEIPDKDDVLPPPDKPEYIASKIIEVIETGEPEIFAHEWMKDIK